MNDNEFIEKLKVILESDEAKELYAELETKGTICGMSIQNYINTMFDGMKGGVLK